MERMRVENCLIKPQILMEGDDDEYGSFFCHNYLDNLGPGDIASRVLVQIPEGIDLRICDKPTCHWFRKTRVSD